MKSFAFKLFALVVVVSSLGCTPSMNARATAFAPVDPPPPPPKKPGDTPPDAPPPPPPSDPPPQDPK
jgi:hypothetical protein